MYCLLAAPGAELQIKFLVKGSIKTGDAKEELITAMIQCIEYVSFFNASNTKNIIQNN